MQKLEVITTRILEKKIKKWGKKWQEQGRSSALLRRVPCSAVAGSHINGEEDIGDVPQ